jgi:hypothetical protein
MTKIDWSKPVELDDGTPLIARDIGETYHVDIRTVAGRRHSAFPSSTYGKGAARRETGLVISNHKFHVRNIARRTIDLAFRVDDPVIYDNREWKITAVDGRYFTLRASNGDTAGNLQVKHLKFACHSHTAPFTTISCDHVEDFADGYQSGLALEALNTSGPIEPLPALPAVTVRYQCAAHGYVTGSTWGTESAAREEHPNTCEGVLKVTRTDGKVTNVEFLP